LPDFSRPLLAALAAQGADLTALEWHEARAWASVTFAGERHRLCYLWSGAEAVERAEQFLARLDADALRLPRALVADAAAVEVFHNAHPAWLRAVVEVLVLEDCA
jgi:hypothetical protein